jgi:hypothetical protein
MCHIPSASASSKRKVGDEMGFVIAGQNGVRRCRVGNMRLQCRLLHLGLPRPPTFTIH